MTREIEEDEKKTRQYIELRRLTRSDQAVYRVERMENDQVMYRIEENEKMARQCIGSDGIKENEKNGEK